MSTTKLRELRSRIEAVRESIVSMAVAQGWEDDHEQAAEMTRLHGEVMGQTNDIRRFAGPWLLDLVRGTAPLRATCSDTDLSPTSI